MKNTFGQQIGLTLFGESHGAAVGAVVDGLSPGIIVDEKAIEKRLYLRRPQGEISTARRERDNFTILSGVFEGKTTGTPVCIVIPNENVRSHDYLALRAKRARGTPITRRFASTTAMKTTGAAAIFQGGSPPPPWLPGRCFCRL